MLASEARLFSCPTYLKVTASLIICRYISPSAYIHYILPRLRADAEVSSFGTDTCTRVSVMEALQVSMRSAVLHISALHTTSSTAQHSISPVAQHCTAQHDLLLMPTSRLPLTPLLLPRPLLRARRPPRWCRSSRNWSPPSQTPS